MVFDGDAIRNDVQPADGLASRQDTGGVRTPKSLGATSAEISTLIRADLYVKRIIIIESNISICKE